MSTHCPGKALVTHRQNGLLRLEETAYMLLKGTIALSVTRLTECGEQVCSTRMREGASLVPVLLPVRCTTRSNSKKSRKPRRKSALVRRKRCADEPVLTIVIQSSPLRRYAPCQPASDADTARCMICRRSIVTLRTADATFRQFGSRPFTTQVGGPKDR